MFWLSVFLLLHTYILYPLIMAFLAKGKSLNENKYLSNNDLPSVAVLMAAHNEEAVIGAKMQTLLQQDYPLAKLHIYVGSDNSSDKTNKILRELSWAHDNIHFIAFAERQGKPSIINQLAKMAGREETLIYLCTDASVMLRTNTITRLVQHFSNPEIGLVDAHMTYTGTKAEGISESEDQYLNGELRLKHNESKAWGKMIGPFGGCFAMRSVLYQPVPKHFLVDDFHLAMLVLEQEKLVINELSAICEEPVSHEIKEEFKRKQRISAGNFQNLFRFRKALNPFSKLGFAFISHKALRWIGPLLMIMLFFSSLCLAWLGSWFFSLVVGLQIVWHLLIPLLDLIFKKMNIQLKPLRHVAYFNMMNWALLSGFFLYLRGIESGIWTPTRRV